MIDKDTSATNAVNVRETSPRVTALRDKLGWLHEWERALYQRERIARSESAGHEGCRAETSDANTRAYDEGTGLGDQAGSSDGEAGHVPRDANPRNATGVVVREWGEINTISDVSAREPSCVVGATGTFQAQSASVRLPAGEDTARFQWPNRGQPLQLCNVHVAEVENQVKVWIRQSGLEAGERLLAAIRSQLQASGRSLAYVAINGKCVWEQPKADSGEPESVSDGNVNRVV